MMLIIQMRKHFPLLTFFQMCQPFFYIHLKILYFSCAKEKYDLVQEMFLRPPHITEYCSFVSSLDRLVDYIFRPCRSASTLKLPVLVFMEWDLHGSDNFLSFVHFYSNL